MKQKILESLSNLSQLRKLSFRDLLFNNEVSDANTFNRFSEYYYSFSDKSYIVAAEKLNINI